MCVKWLKEDGKGGYVEMTQEEWMEMINKPVMDALKAQFDEENLKKEEIEEEKEKTTMPTNFNSYEELFEYHKIPKYNIMKVD